MQKHMETLHTHACTHWDTSDSNVGYRSFVPVDSHTTNTRENGRSGSAHKGKWKVWICTEDMKADLPSPLMAYCAITICHNVCMTLYVGKRKYLNNSDNQTPL